MQALVFAAPIGLPRPAEVVLVQQVQLFDCRLQPEEVPAGAPLALLRLSAQQGLDDVRMHLPSVARTDVPDQFFRILCRIGGQFVQPATLSFRQCPGFLSRNCRADHPRLLGQTIRQPLDVLGNRVPFKLVQRIHQQDDPPSARRRCKGILKDPAQFFQVRLLWNADFDPRSRRQLPNPAA